MSKTIAIVTLIIVSISLGQASEDPGKWMKWNLVTMDLIQSNNNL